jgi:hypothetical protein
MPKTIEVRKDVFVTGSVACDFKELREFYRSNVETFIKAFDECSKIFKVKNTKLLFNNIRKKGEVGCYVHGINQVKIDIRSFDVKQIVSTIIHEMTHAQQAQNGKLSPSKDGKSMIWAKKEFAKAKTHDEYLNLPWEIEARNNEKKYIDQVMKAIA